MNTPGPWKVRIDNRAGGFCTIHKENGDCIGSAYTPAYGYLYAAAPDMADALLLLVEADMHDPQGPTAYDMYIKGIKAAKEALEKAGKELP